MIKTVIFDMDGTMYDFNHCNRVAMDAVKKYCLLHLHIDSAAFHTAQKQANETMAKQMGTDCAAFHNRLIRFQCMLESWKLPLFPYAKGMYHMYWDTLLDEMKPYEGFVEWVQMLKNTGYSIGVGTNMTAYIQYQKLERLGVASMIDWIVTSEEAGAEKPNPRFFSLCSAKSGGRPEEVLFVGDSLEHDMEGAKAAGMKTLWVTPIPGQQPEDERKYQTISSFRECLETDFAGLE